MSNEEETVAQRGRLAAIAAALLLLGACSDGQDEQADPIPIGGEDDDPTDGSDDQTEADGSENVEDDDPYTMPDEIDEAYTEDVINALLEIEGEGVTIARSQEPGENLAPDAIERFDAISAGQRLDGLMELYQLYLDEPELTDGYLPAEEIGTTSFEVHGILHVEPEQCMLVVGWWDRSEAAVEATDPGEESLVSLGPVEDSPAAREFNPTPWQVRELAPMEIDGEPVPEDRWDDIDFGDELDRTCQDR